MPESKIVVVVPTCRPESHKKFVEAWRPLFEKHAVTLVTVWDGDELRVQVDSEQPYRSSRYSDNPDLFCRHTDACRNLGFVVAAGMNPDFVLTLDDDCYPFYDTRSDYPRPDPIQAHLDALSRRVPVSWMNTAHDTDLYLRGVPYGVRDEAPVMLSHGVWVGVPDFDGETQLRLEKSAVRTDDGANHGCESWTGGIPHSLPYYVGPIPRSVLFPLCGMNVMVRREALPYLYYAPMGLDSGVKVVRICAGCWNEGGLSDVPGFVCGKCKGVIPVDTIHRFADIFMGVFLKRTFDQLNWACVTGYSTIHHTRASDAKRNFEQEKLGREWMEFLWTINDPWKNKVDVPAFYHETGMGHYVQSYAAKRARYVNLITSLLQVKS